jgi:peptide/nickel transport system substrate-binding protein
LPSVQTNPQPIYSNELLQNLVYPIIYRDKGGKLMEGEGEIPLPEERGGGGGSMTKVIAAIVVIIIVVAAIAGALILMGGEAENKGPTAVATASETLAMPGDTITYDGTASDDPDGEIADFSWNFGDGATTSGNMSVASIVSHEYDYPGKYIIVLTVTDDKDKSDSNWKSLLYVEILNPETTGDITNDTVPFAIGAASAQVVENDTAIDFDGNASRAYSIEPQYNETDVLTSWAAEFDVAFIEEMFWSWGDGNSFSGNYTEAGLASYTYTGDGVVYASYLRVTSIHDAIQRYYHTVVILPADVTGGGAVKNPDLFVEVTIGEPKTLDPSVAYDTASGEVLENVYEHLIYYDRESTVDLVPQLATAVPTVGDGISADGLNYTFTLREGVKFHYTNATGVAYTMDGYDVEYSIERVLTMNDPEGPGWMLAQIMYPSWPGPNKVLDPNLINASIEVNPTDAFEVTFHLISPYPGFLKVLAYTVGSVICTEAVEDHGGVVPITQNEWMIRTEAGTGPYVLMERFDDYWREPAPVKFVIIKKVQDTGTRLMMLLAGDADFAYVPRLQRPSVINNDDLTIVEGLPTFDMDFLGFNWNMSGTLDVGTVPMDFFADMNIRNAFIHSFDFDNFLANVWLDTAIQPNGPIPMGMFAYDPSIPNYTTDYSLAAEFLNKTTYGEDGFTIRLYYNAGNDEREAACFLLRDGLGIVSNYIAGEINVEVQALDWPTYLDALYGFALPVFFLGWGPDYADPDDYVNPFLHSNGAYPYFLSLSNATLDDMIIEAAMELNETLRAEMYLEISQAVYENAYYVWTAQPTNFHVQRAWVVGYYFNPMFSQFIFYDMSK